MTHKSWQKEERQEDIKEGTEYQSEQIKEMILNVIEDEENHLNH